jgi:hypothetical protein
MQDNDGFALERVTGLTPLEFFGQLRVEKDCSQLLQFSTPLFRSADEGIDVGIRFAWCHGQ